MKQIFSPPLRVSSIQKLSLMLHYFVKVSSDCELSQGAQVCEWSCELPFEKKNIWFMNLKAGKNCSSETKSILQLLGNKQICAAVISLHASSENPWNFPKNLNRSNCTVWRIGETYGLYKDDSWHSFTIE